jgi:hypothetical protein
LDDGCKNFREDDDISFQLGQSSELTSGWQVLRDQARTLRRRQALQVTTTILESR